MINRRNFLKNSIQLGGGAFIFPIFSTTAIAACQSGATSEQASGMFFKISLAEWSLHKQLFAKKLTNMEFPEFTKSKFGISGVEYVSVFFEEKHTDKSYMQELKTRTDDLGIRNVLIMVDREGNLADATEKERKQAVENHYDWIEAAKFLGCHSIRVNARGVGSEQEVMKAAVDGLGRLSEFAKKMDINVIVENHGGYSSNAWWLSQVIQKVKMDNCGTLPDFGNFSVDPNKGIIYPYLKGIAQLMPFAKGVSAKSYDFDADGDELFVDFKKILNIIKNAGYKDYIGIEYEGSRLSEEQGILATKALLEKVGNKL